MSYHFIITIGWGNTNRATVTGLVEGALANASEDEIFQQLWDDVLRKTNEKSGLSIKFEDTTILFYRLVRN